jgi:hypothetical protein
MRHSIAHCTVRPARALPADGTREALELFARHPG